MNRDTHVIVTNRIVGKALIFPYSHGPGGQLYLDPAGHPILDPATQNPLPVLYVVPAYQVIVNGGSRYRAIRFGLQNKGTDPAHRWCDAGISHEVECRPSWDPSYKTASFSSSQVGAWVLFPDKPRLSGFLIHNGPDLSADQFGGSLGCVEILDGRWSSFLLDIERVVGKPRDQLGRERGLIVSFEAAPFPQATLVRKLQHVALDSMLDDPHWGGDRYRPDHR